MKEYIQFIRKLVSLDEKQLKEVFIDVLGYGDISDVERIMIAARNTFEEAENANEMITDDYKYSDYAERHRTWKLEERKPY